MKTYAYYMPIIIYYLFIEDAESVDQPVQMFHTSHRHQVIQQSHFENTLNEDAFLNEAKYFR